MAVKKRAVGNNDVFTGGVRVRRVRVTGFDGDIVVTNVNDAFGNADMATGAGVNGVRVG